MTVTEEIKQKLDIVDLIGSSGVQLRKAGRNFTGFCPFHPNARTPAFYVFPDTQSYYCFSCHKSGDAFAFVMERQGLQFGEALKELAGRAGVQLPDRTPEAREAQEQESALQAKLRQINEDIAVYWNHLLTSTARGEPGRVYVAGRGLDERSIESWQLGYAPEEWGDLLRHLTDRKGHTAEELEQAGLVIKREGGGYYDRFRNRLMFPIRDLKGTIVGFGGRTLGDDHAKYMNTPETSIFHKSSLLFGLWHARDSIKSENKVAIVEGYLDVITAHQAGFKYVVAPMGTALTIEQMQLIRKLKLTENIYLALDRDEAGIRAAEKGADSVVESSEEKLIQYGQNSLEVGLELDLPLKVIELPRGKDPDDVIKSDPEKWRHLVESARSIVYFLTDVYTQGLDLSSPDDQYRALTRIAPYLNRLSDLRRRLYIEHIANNVLHLPPWVVQDMVRQVRQRVRPEPSFGQPKRSAPPTPLPLIRDRYANEDELLSLILRFPSIRERVEATLAGELEAFPDLREDVPGDLRGALARTENRLIWYAWSEHGPDGPADVAAWVTALDPALRTHAERLLEWKDEPPLTKASPRGEARERANGIAQMLRRSIVDKRAGEMKGAKDHLEDPDDRAQLEKKLTLILQYRNVVTAPRKSSIYRDLGSRREEFG